MNRRTILSNIFWKLGERLLAQMVSLVVSIVLARILMPEDYGIISMVSVFITLANVFVTSGIPNALIQKKDADNKDFSSVFFVNLSFSVLLYMVLFFCAPLIAEFYSMNALVNIIRVMGLRVIVAAVNSVQHAYVSKNMMFKRFFWSTLFGTVLSGFIGIWMAYVGFGVWALVAQQMINSTVDTIFLWFTVKWRPEYYFSWEKTKGLLKYGWKVLFEGVSNTVYIELRSLVIGKVYTSADLAYYNRGATLPSLLVDNVSTSISSVLFPAMSKEQDADKRLIMMLRHSTRLTSYLLFPALTGLAIIAPELISLVYTPKWLPAVPYLRIFCLTKAMTIGLIPRHQALNAKGRSDVFMVEHILCRTIGLIVLVSVFRMSVMAYVP